MLLLLDLALKNISCTAQWAGLLHFVVIAPVACAHVCHKCLSGNTLQQEPVHCWLSLVGPGRHTQLHHRQARLVLDIMSQTNMYQTCAFMVLVAHRGQRPQSMVA